MKLFTPIFSLTLLLSAFLLFAIQPLFSKMILPYLGGSPMVWNTAMVFFQGMLLAGYGYAYFCSKIPKISIQVIVHSLLFFIFLVFLPFSINESDIPSNLENPTFWQIGLMFSTIGAPFFILSGCAPLLQRWFSFSSHKDAENPYFLYAASNLGSMTALLSYPFIVEPLFNLSEQSHIWSALYLLLACLITVSGILTLRNAKQSPFKTTISDANATLTAPTWSKRCLWLVLAFIPSSLMLGVTTYITTDIASLPLLWVLPLAIYVGTFIIAFANKKPFTTDKASLVQVFALIVLIACPISISIGFYLILHLAVFGIITLVLHMRLADAKPTPEHLTEFYFIMSLGGVLGGIFNALLSPVIFNVPWEYSLMIIASAFFINPKKIYAEIIDKKFLSNGLLAISILGLTVIVFGLTFLSTTPNQHTLSAIILILMAVYLLFIWDKRMLFACSILIILLIRPFHVNYDNSENIFETRSFFGSKSVISHTNYLGMQSGTTLHGIQFKDEDKKTIPTTYYNIETANGQAFEDLHKRVRSPKVAAIGLGTGTIACSIEDNENFDYYEIDPVVIDMSIKYKFFTFLDKCTENPRIFIGDGRLKIQDRDDHYYDAIFIDAFSSDSIPVHLITEEAVKLYLQKLDEDGIIIFHISNRHIDLLPVLATIANALDISHVYNFTKSTTEEQKTGQQLPTKTVVIAKKPDVLSGLRDIGWTNEGEIGPQFHWTDNYANIISTLVISRVITLAIEQSFPTDEKERMDEQALPDDN